MHESGSAAVSSQTLKVDGRGALLTTTAAVILMSFQYKNCAGYNSEALQRLLHGAAASTDSRAHEFALAITAWASARNGKEMGWRPQS